MKICSIYLFLLVFFAYSVTWADQNVQVQINGSAMNAAIQQHNRTLAGYQQMVNQIVAGKVREVRVEEEQTAMQSAGHPVALPTGSCRAIVTVNPDGTVDRSQLAGCSSPELGKAELEAIHRASPLPPLGKPVIVTVTTMAPVATPGVNGKGSAD